MKKKDFFNGNVKNPRGFWVSLILINVIFLAVALLCFCVALFYDNVADSYRVAFVVTGAVLLVLMIVLFVSSILLARAWPKYAKLTKLLWREYMFYSPEELEMMDKAETVEQKSDDEPTRKLTITRKKAVAGCAVKVKLYISSETDCDLVLSVYDTDFHANEQDRSHSKKFRYLGKIGNGKSVQFDIPQTQVYVAALYDSVSAEWCRDTVVIPAGSEDVCLSGKCILKPLGGNPFIFNK